MGDVFFPGVEELANQFLSEAEKIIGRLTLNVEAPLPENGQIAVRVLTPLGARPGFDDQNRVEEGIEPFAATGFAAAQLISKLMDAYHEQQNR